jgi:hypothetical protein
VRDVLRYSQQFFEMASTKVPELKNVNNAKKRRIERDANDLTTGSAKVQSKGAPDPKRSAEEHEYGALDPKSAKVQSKGAPDPKRSAEEHEYGALNPKRTYWTRSKNMINVNLVTHQCDHHYCNYCHTTSDTSQFSHSPLDIKFCLLTSFSDEEEKLT